MKPQRCGRCGRLYFDPIWHEYCEQKPEKSKTVPRLPDDPKTYEEYVLESQSHNKRLMQKYGAKPGAKVPESFLKPSEYHHISPSIRN